MKRDPPKSKEPKRRGRPPAASEVLHAAHAAARARICEAALILFDRGGISAIGMRDIAREMGVSAMMPYKYFASKDHILQELRTLAFQDLERWLLAAASGCIDPAERLETILITYLRRGREDQRAYRLMFDYWVYDDAPGLLAEFGESAKRQSGAWEVVVQGVEDYLHANHIEADPVAAAHLVWASVHGLVSLEAARKLVFGNSFEELAAPMVRMIMASLPKSCK